MRLRTLGALELEGTAFRRPKPLLLLSYLAVEGPRERRYLAELFWPDRDDPLNNLSKALARLRRGAPGTLGADSERVWSNVVTDAREMLSAFERSDLERAVALYRGPFLDGLNLPEIGSELQEWLYRTREFLAGRVQLALLSLGESLAERGNFAAAAANAESALRLQGAAGLEAEGLERAYLLLVGGDSALAAEVRREAAEFGITLGLSRDAARERFQALSERLPGHNLPPRRTSFVGRSEELDKVAELFAHDECRLLTLTGPGGVGKTRLALESAHRQLSNFADGVYFVSLEPLRTAEEIALSVASTLGLELGSHEEPAARLCRYCRDRRLLLVLDNFEHLVAGAPIAARLLEECPRLRLLVTSRERLNLVEEWLLPVGSLPYPANDELTPEEALSWESVQLFIRRARQVEPDFRLCDRKLPHVLAICRAVEGLPLGLELAAPWVRHLPVAQIAREIGAGLDLPHAGARNAGERHKSLRAAFEHSWKLLAASERRVLERLSVFRGGFLRQAAAEVAGAGIAALSALVDKSLLRLSPAERYDLHPLLGEFAREKLAGDSGQRFSAETAHAHYYLRFVGERYDEIHGAKPMSKGAIAHFEAELSNVIAAWNWGMHRSRVEETEKQFGVGRLVQAVLFLYTWQGWLRAGIELLRRTEQELLGAEARADSVLGQLRLGQAWLWWRCGRYRQAERLAESGLCALGPHGQPAAISFGLNTLGLAAVGMGRYAEARERFEEARALLDDSEHENVAAFTHGNLGIVAGHLGDYEAAVRCLREQVAVHRRLVKPVNVVVGLNLLGEALIVAGRAEEARAVLEESLQLARDADFQVGVRGGLLRLGLAAYRLGNHREAEAYARQALEVISASDEPAARARALTLLGRIATALDDPGAAHDRLIEALKLWRDLDDVPGLLHTLVGLAELRGRLGEEAQAVSLLQTVLANRGTQHPDRDFAEQLLRSMGTIGRVSTDAGADLTRVVAEVLEASTVR